MLNSCMNHGKNLRKDRGRKWQSASRGRRIRALALLVYKVAQELGAERGEARRCGRQGVRACRVG